MHKWPGWMLISLSLMVFATGCGCGDDDDDDDSAPSDDDTTDDDTTDDDSTDDDTTDDDTTDDDTTDDDTTDDDTDVEYDSLECDLPDPASLGSGNLIGGGSPTGTIDVYVFDGETCDPIENAEVAHGGATYTTDVDGYAEVLLTDAAELVTAWEDNHWAWSYTADASVMYFRLRPDEYAGTYSDSDLADFTQDGTPLSLAATTLGNLFSSPIYLGAALPGISLETLFGADYDNFFTQGAFDLTLNTGSPEVTEVPLNVYLPGIDITVLTYGVEGENPQYAVPVNSAAATSPVEGFVAAVDVAAAIPNLATLTSVITCVVANPDDILGCVSSLIEPILNEGLTIQYAGADPGWDGAGAPDIEVADGSAKGSFDVAIANPDASYDYLAIAGALIPNRAILPTALGLADGNGDLTLDTIAIPDADYGVLVGQTDLLVSGLTSMNFSFAIRWAESLSDWSTGVDLDADTDFLPNFDAGNTSYDDVTGELSWALEAGDAPDVYQIVYVPEGQKVVFAQVPGTATSWEPPVTEMGIVPGEGDIVVIFGIDLPDDVDVDAYNPLAVPALKSSAVNLWTNLVLSL
ncbi:MAG: hypothetical protein IT350_11625 [Deltaproteobacteria bacterium]|nr:hypothetical protein [Deltaproteobacteria bacterium]